MVIVGPFPKEGNVSDDIKKAAFEKFSDQNRVFKPKYNSNELFHLLYPDGSIVNKIPGSDEPFSIKGYRDSIDPQRRFDRLRLFLCTKGKINR